MVKRTHAQKLLLLGLLTACLLCCLLLTSCECKHEWADATCNAAKTCTKCGETEGEPIAHNWLDPTCQRPKTCKLCKATDGTELAEHDYQPATSQKPKTCRFCGKTSGDPLTVDHQFNSELCQPLFGTWTAQVYMDGDALQLPDFKTKTPLNYTLTFQDDGNYKASLVFVDKEAFKEDLKNYYMKILYAEFTDQGMSKKQADEAMIAVYGKNVTDYAQDLVDSVDWDQELEKCVSSGVYHISSGGKLYRGANWKDCRKSDTIRLTAFTLELETLSQQFPGLFFRKVPNT